MDTTFRKAAILIDTLDAATASVLLDRMDAAEAARIREARVQLHGVSEAERRRVILEFHEENSLGPVGLPGEIESSPALKLIPADPPDELTLVKKDEPAATKPFEFLCDAETTALARHLAKEDSHKVAIVLCHLPPSRAADILKQLPDSKRIDIVIRMSGIDELTLKDVNHIETELKELLGKGNSSTGFGAILSIMESVDTWSRSEIIGQLKSQNRELAEQLTVSIGIQDELVPESLDSTAITVSSKRTPETVDQDSNEIRDAAEVFEFEDLVQLDSRSFATLLQEADPDEMLLALTGASPWMVNRLLDHLPPRDEKLLRQKMDRCGPLTLKDIDVAQQKLVQLTDRLASEGKLNPPTRRPFTSLV